VVKKEPERLKHYDENHDSDSDSESRLSKMSSGGEKCSFTFGCDCLLGPRSCRLCCGCLPAINESTGTKLMYSILLILFTILATVLSSSKVVELVKNEPFFEKFCDSETTGQITCEQIFSTTGTVIITVPQKSNTKMSRRLYRLFIAGNVFLHTNDLDDRH
jgi:hypothetical protein